MCVSVPIVSLQGLGEPWARQLVCVIHRAGPDLLPPPHELHPTPPHHITHTHTHDSTAAGPKQSPRGTCGDSGAKKGNNASAKEMPLGCGHMLAHSCPLLVHLRQQQPPTHARASTGPQEGFKSVDTGMGRQRDSGAMEFYLGMDTFAQRAAASSLVIHTCPRVVLCFCSLFWQTGSIFFTHTPLPNPLQASLQSQKGYTLQRPLCTARVAHAPWPHSGKHRDPHQ